MGERACLFQHDRTTANGVVLDCIDGTGLDERGLSYLGARVQCPACGTMGRIEADGPRDEADAIDDKLPALENDLCLCACTPPPRLIASQREWTVDV